MPIVLYYRHQTRLGDLRKQVIVAAGHLIGKVMATSSITANFTISDPKAARAFVRAFCSVESAPCRAPSCIGEELTDPVAIRAFFAEHSTTKVRHRRVAAR